MKLKKIELPKKYEYKEGVTNPLYERYHNWQKVSYSQLNSFQDYKEGYIQDYIIKCGNNESGIFAEMGSAVGQLFEDGTRNPYLSDEDVATVSKIPKYETSRCESEIVIDLEPFGLEKTCLQGFSDHEWNCPENNWLNIDDLKTGNTDNMMSKYADMQKYYQTRLYMYQRELEGHLAGNCQVIHLGRKGNTIDKNAMNKKGEPLYLRLSGKIDYIPNPYEKEDVEYYLKNKVVPTCIEISEYFKVYNKFFNKNLQD